MTWPGTTMLLASGTVSTDADRAVVGLASALLLLNCIGAGAGLKSFAAPNVDAVFTSGWLLLGIGVASGKAAAGGVNDVLDFGPRPVDPEDIVAFAVASRRCVTIPCVTKIAASASFSSVSIDAEVNAYARLENTSNTPRTSPFTISGRMTPDPNDDSRPTRGSFFESSQ